MAHKMGRRWVGIEREPDTIESYALPRLSKVVAGEDPGGITEDVDWEERWCRRHRSSAKHLIAVPLQQRGVGSVGGGGRHMQRRSIQRVVGGAIGVIVVQGAAHAQHMTGGHRDVAAVKQAMEVAAKQQPV